MPAEPFSLSAALHGASLVQDLISQATHRAAGVIWLRVEVAGSGSQLPDGRALPRRRADVLYSPARFVENNLLTAVGAAEVLHRNLRIDEKPFPKADFSAMREAMLAQVPEEHRDRLKGAIRNDPTLRIPLIALFVAGHGTAILLRVSVPSGRLSP